tara:strand:- start:1716 stop:3332 length:1617 start_codon:yes stop_codon:yes gene_type:complete
MGEIEKIQEYIKEIKSVGFKALSNNVRLSKKDLGSLEKIVADIKLGGNIVSPSDKVNIGNLVSEGSDDAFDSAIVKKILESSGNHGLGKFKDTNLANIGDTANIGGVKSKQIFKQSAGIQEAIDDIAIAKSISSKPTTVNKGFSDNELRLTKQYRDASLKGLSDSAALRVTKSTINRANRIDNNNIAKTLPSYGTTAKYKANQAAEISSEFLETQEKASGLYGDKYFGQADSHVKEYTLVSEANKSEIGKQIPFTSSAEVKEYNNMIKEFDKVEYSSAEKQAYYADKRLDDTSLENLESNRVGLTGSINTSEATQLKPMTVENYGGMQMGGGFDPAYKSTLDEAVKIEYAKKYGDTTVPINSLDPLSKDKTIGQLGGKIGDTFTYGISKSGKEQFFTVGPAIDWAQENKMGVVALGADDSSPRYNSEFIREAASKKQPGKIEEVVINKKDPKPTNVPYYNPSTERPTQSTKRIYEQTDVGPARTTALDSFVRQFKELKAMYPNVANKNNLVRLAGRNIEKQLGLPANKKLLLNLSKFF